MVHYYGDQKITLDEWQAVENAYRKSGEQNPSVDEFFASVKAWLAKGNGEESYFWFLGI